MLDHQQQQTYALDVINLGHHSLRAVERAGPPGSPVLGVTSGGGSPRPRRIYAAAATMAAPSQAPVQLFDPYEALARYGQAVPPVGAFDATQHSDGTYTIHRVPIFSVHVDERGPVPEVYDLGYLEQCVTKAHVREKFGGYLGPIHVRHHPSETVVPAGNLRVLGIANMLYEGVATPTVFSDLVRVPPEAFEAIKAGRLPYRSVELPPEGPANPEILSLALLDHEVPYFRYANMQIRRISAEGQKARTYATVACYGQGCSGATRSVTFRFPSGSAQPATNFSACACKTRTNMANLPTGLSPSQPQTVQWAPQATTPGTTLPTGAPPPLMFSQIDPYDLSGMGQPPAATPQVQTLPPQGIATPNQPQQQPAAQVPTQPQAQQFTLFNTQAQPAPPSANPSVRMGEGGTDPAGMIQGVMQQLQQLLSMLQPAQEEGGNAPPAMQAVAEQPAPQHQANPQVPPSSPNAPVSMAQLQGQLVALQQQVRGQVTKTAQATAFQADLQRFQAVGAPPQDVQTFTQLYRASPDSARAYAQSMAQSYASEPQAPPSSFATTNEIPAPATGDAALPQEVLAYRQISPEAFEQAKHHYSIWQTGSKRHELGKYLDCLVNWGTKRFWHGMPQPHAATGAPINGVHTG